MSGTVYVAGVAEFPDVSNWMGLIFEWRTGFGERMSLLPVSESPGCKRGLKAVQYLS